MLVCVQVNQKGSAATLAAKRLAGVAPEVNLMTLLHAGEEAFKGGIHPDWNPGQTSQNMFNNNPHYEDSCPPIFTAHNKVGARLCFYTCLLFCSQGGLPHCMLGYPPRTRGRHPPIPGTPREQTPPGPGTPSAVHDGRYGQQAVGTHPTKMHSCLKTKLMPIFPILRLCENPDCQWCFVNFLLYWNGRSYDVIYLSVLILSIY